MLPGESEERITRANDGILTAMIARVLDYTEEEIKVVSL